MRTLNLIAANGTDSLKAPLETIHPDLDPLLDTVKTENKAEKLLMGAGLLTMHKMAGYSPDKDTRPLETVLQADEEHQQVPYSSVVIDYLRLIYHSKYNRTYSEWLHWVALENITFPYEAIPIMLDLATFIPRTRELTKRVLGSRGRWLIKQNVNQDWVWAKHAKPARRPRLTKYEKYEARVTIMLQKVRYQRIPVAVSNELNQMRFPWSARFSETIARTISNMLERQNNIAIADLIRLTHRIQWSLHYSEHKNLINCIQRYHSGQDFQDLAIVVAKILEFRAQLSAVFESDST